MKKIGKGKKMGKLIQCAGRLAKKPFHFRATGDNVYSIEEVCCYIGKNIYMLQKEMFNADFAAWLKDELSMDETARKMEDMLRRDGSLKDAVVTLCCSCDYYDEKEINDLIKIMDKIQNLPFRKKQKIKADNCLRCGFYEKALEEYGRILKCGDMLRADISEYGGIYHNMGVAYANLGDYKDAQISFSMAYEKSRNRESLREYIYCLLIAGEDEKYEMACRQYDMTEEERDAIKKDFEEIGRESASAKDVQRISHLKDVLDAGYVDEYRDQVDGYIRLWKNEYREGIGI